jgi:hypothetical protein
VAAASSKAMCQSSVPAGPVVGPASEKNMLALPESPRQGAVDAQSSCILSCWVSFLKSAAGF